MHHVKAIALLAADKTLNRTLALLLGVLAFWAFTTFLPIGETQVKPSETPHQQVEVVPDHLTRVMDRRLCWTDEAPPKMEGKFPTGVLLTDGTVGGPRMVDRALEQIFEGKDHGLTVYAFCR